MVCRASLCPLIGTHRCGANTGRTSPLSRGQTYHSRCLIANAGGVTGRTPPLTFTRIILQVSLNLMISAVLLVWTGYAQAAADFHWHNRGPAGGYVGQICIDPSDPQRLYAVTRWREGLYTSGDGGDSWDLMSLGTGIYDRSPVVSCYVHPAEHGVLYVKVDDGRVLPTSDGGRVWECLIDPHSGTCWGIVDLAFAPSDPTVICVAEGSPGVLCSSDNGQSWSRVFTGDARQVRIGPGAATLYATVGHSLYRTQDGGETWVQVMQVANDDVRIRDVLLHPQQAGALLVATTAGIWHSIDSGNTWALTDTHSVSGLVTDAAGERVLAGYDAGLLHSADWGHSWQAIGSATGAAARNVALAIDPHDPQRLYVGEIANHQSSSRLFRSDDGGLTWQVRQTGMIAHPAWRVEAGVAEPDEVYVGWSGNQRLQGRVSFDRGLTSRPIGDWVIPPSRIDAVDPLMQYGINSNSGFRSTRDGGQTWDILWFSRGNPNHPKPGIINTVVAHPRQSGVVYLGMEHGVYKSETAGQTWRELTDGVRNVDVTHLAIDSSDPRRFYYTAGGRHYDSGVFRSIDEGRTWQELTIDWPNPAVTIRPWYVYVSWCGGVFVLSNQGILMSPDGGDTWTFITGDLPETALHEVSVSPLAPVVYLGTENGLFVLEHEIAHAGPLTRGGKDLPVKATLLPNYPNPFNAYTVIPFRLGQSGAVEVQVYNIAGQIVRHLAPDPLPYGFHAIEWDGRDDTGQRVSSGVYMVLLRTRNGVAAQKAVYIK